MTKTKLLSLVLVSGLLFTVSESFADPKEDTQASEDGKQKEELKADPGPEKKVKQGINRKCYINGLCVKSS